MWFDDILGERKEEKPIVSKLDTSEVTLPPLLTSIVFGCEGNFRWFAVFVSTCSTSPAKCCWSRRYATGAWSVQLLEELLRGITPVVSLNQVCSHQKHSVSGWVGAWRKWKSRLPGKSSREIVTIPDVPAAKARFPAAAWKKASLCCCPRHSDDVKNKKFQQFMTEFLRFAFHWLHQWLHWLSELTEEKGAVQWISRHELSCAISNRGTRERGLVNMQLPEIIENVEGSSIILHGFSFSDASQRVKVSRTFCGVQTIYQAVRSSLEAVSEKTNKLEIAILVWVPPQCVALYSQFL